MTNETEKTGALARWASGGGSIAKKADIAKALLESAAIGGTGSSDVEFLSFSGQGATYKGWSLGRDRRTPDPEAVYIVDPQSAVEGWTCWKGGSPVEKHEWSIYHRAEQAIPAGQLKDHNCGPDDGWSLMLGVSLFDVDDPSQQIKFTTTTTSAKNAISDLNTEIAKNIVAGEPDVPVVKLSSSTFTSRGKINGKPVFEIVGWTTDEEIAVFLGLGDDGDVEDLVSGAYANEAEAPGEAPDMETEPPEPVEPAPKRRARRSAA